MVKETKKSIKPVKKQSHADYVRYGKMGAAASAKIPLKKYKQWGRLGAKAAADNRKLGTTKPPKKAK